MNHSYTLVLEFDAVAALLLKYVLQVAAGQLGQGKCACGYYKQLASREMDRERMGERGWRGQFKLKVLITGPSLEFTGPGTQKDTLLSSGHEELPRSIKDLT
ncbi:hypothetical protein ROHU_030224 [Labeo rohita]|uniref:Uncharacterized protein n=1 Tax=Labeo rohita TaxID=84645 RepID=A0A498LWB6_LABRO|nr:hypothetical protein ROHU_030224 [Labeo rohita]